MRAQLIGMVVAASCGCRGIYHVGLGDDGGSAGHDAPLAADAPTAFDARVGTDACVGSAGPDEDGDGVPDSCDDCPVDVNPDQTDSDRDGVGDLCDAHPDDTATPDRVLLFLPFNDPDELGYFVSGSATYGSGVILFPEGTTTLETTSAFSPTRIQLGVRYDGVHPSDTIELLVSDTGLMQYGCLADSGDSRCGSASACLGVQTPSALMTTDWVGEPSLDALRADTVGTLQCTGDVSGQATTDSATLPVPPGAVGVIASLLTGSTAIVRYLIIYGYGQ